ncbi:MAG: hypothetical protein ABSC77_03740 [Terracidiphilus sp.]|jgi:hypothetical protein
MKRYASWLILVALLFMVSVLIAANGNAQAKYKVVEVKHLTVADGVSVTDKYLNDSYDYMREGLAKTGIFETVVEDGGAISDADAANAVVLECKIIKYRGNAYKTMSGPYVKVEVTLSNRGDHQLIKQFTSDEIPLNVSNKAKNTGRFLTSEIKHKLK